MISQSKVEEFGTINVAHFGPVVSGKKRYSKWECGISETIVGDYLIIPLTSAKRLKSEGYLMNNCCRDYIVQCADLVYGLFSIRRRSGERLATLGLTCDDGYWRFDQCMGPFNSDVVEEIREYIDEDGVIQAELSVSELYYVAHEVARLMNSTAQSHPTISSRDFGIVNN